MSSLKIPLLLSSIKSLKSEAVIDSFFNFAEKMSPLGNATAEECADYIVMMFSDFTKKVTMQNLFHDGGYSFTGISEELIEEMK